jgi:hypothetical protein
VVCSLRTNNVAAAKRFCILKPNWRQLGAERDSRLVLQGKRMLTTANTGLVPFWHHINRNLVPKRADSQMIGWLGVDEKDQNYRIIAKLLQ